MLVPLGLYIMLGHNITHHHLVFQLEHCGAWHHIRLSKVETHQSRKLEGTSRGFGKTQIQKKHIQGNSLHAGHLNPTNQFMMSSSPIHKIFTKVIFSINKNIGTLQDLLSYNICEQCCGNSLKCSSEGLCHFPSILAYLKVHKSFISHSNDLKTLI